MTFYSHHRLGDRLLDRVSGLAAGLAPHTGASATRRAPRSPSNSRAWKRSAATRWWTLGRRPLDEIEKDPALLALARASGKTVFGDNCAPCHGSGGAGAKGYPNLNDDEWLWGGTLDQIMQTIQFGARSGPRRRPTRAPCWPSARTACSRRTRS